MSSHISQFSAEFPIKFSFRSVTWYLRISLQHIRRILSLGCDATRCGGYLHILEHSKVLPLWVPSHPGREYSSVFCIIEIYSLQYFCVILLHVMTVTCVKFGWWNEADVTWWDLTFFHRCCWRFHSSGMQHCVVGQVVSHILKDHSAVKTPGTAFPTTHCHGPEDRYLQGWNLSQINKHNSQILRVVSTNRWKVWL